MWGLRTDLSLVSFNAGETRRAHVRQADILLPFSRLISLLLTADHTGIGLLSLLIAEVEAHPHKANLTRLSFFLLASLPHTLTTSS